jgi:acylphosphatase
LLVTHGRISANANNVHLSATISCPVSDAKQAKRYFVSGGVQGVGFRYFTQNAAEQLRLSGFVRNLRDGRVEAFAWGTPQQLAHFRNMLHQGPRFAQVQEVREEDAEADQRFTGKFIITHED